MPETHPLAVLLTGFGPFPGAERNVSADLVRTAARRLRHRYPEVGFHVVILPTEWARAPVALQRQYHRLRPAIAVHFGISSTARTLVIETRAANSCRPLPDAKDALPPAPFVSPGGPAALKVTLPIDRILRHLRRHAIPHTRSTDAGNYLCNAALYHSLWLSREMTPRGRAGFIHIPANLEKGNGSPGLGGLPWEAAVCGAVFIVAAAIEA